jgi:acyl carrier protein
MSGGISTMEEIKETVKAYILKEFLPGEDPKALTDTTPLITGGILDSIATLKLVAFIEERYGFTLRAHEVDVENLNTVADITRLILSKLGENGDDLQRPA